MLRARGDFKIEITHKGFEKGNSRVLKRREVLGETSILGAEEFHESDGDADDVNY